MAAVAYLVAFATVLVANPTPASAAVLNTPASITVTPGRMKIVVAWTPANPLGGTVNRYRATTNSGEWCQVSGSTFSCPIINLQPNTPYTVSVKACPNADNDTDCSAPRTAVSAVTPGPPGTPAAPNVAFHSDPNSVRVSWAHPEPGAGIASYRVTPTPSAGLTGTCTALVAYPANFCDYTGLVDDTSYTFRVTANGIANSAGSTGSTVAGAASAPKVAGLPGVPAQPVALRESDTEVTVIWEKPAGNQALSGYTVAAAWEGGSLESACPGSVTDPEATYCRITELDPTETYTFTVQANGAIPDGGDSGPSEASEPITPGLPGLPDVPTVELGAEAGEVTVRWQPPADGGAVMTYRVTAASSDESATVPEACERPGDVTYCDFAVDTGKPYTFTVTAINAAGEQTSTATDPVVSQLPEQPATPEALVGDAPGKVVLTWDAPTGGGSVAYYTVIADPTPDDAPTGEQSFDCGFNLEAPTCEITELDPSASYTFQVKAVGDLGTATSSPSNSVVPDMPGQATSAAVAEGDDATQATVTWAQPEAGGAVEGYTVFVESSDDETPPAECPKGPEEELSCDFTGLDPTKSYTFIVQASNPAGVADATAVPDQASLPGEPTDVAVDLVADTPGALHVTWVAPEGGGTLNRYVVMATSPDEGTQPDDCTVAADATPECDFADLDLDKSYVFTVWAQNALGGTPSAETEAIVANKPGAPTSVVVTVTDDGMATVTWGEPADGGVVDQYTVTADTDGGTVDSSCAPVAGDAERTCDFVMDPGFSYTFTVNASNVAGDMDSEATAPVIPAAAGAPTGVEVALGDAPGKLIVTWVAPEGSAVTTYTVTGDPEGDGTVPDPCEVAGNAEELSCLFEGLTVGDNYSFTVRADNDAGGDDFGPTEPVMPDKPGEAGAVAPELVADTPGSVTVTWDEPTEGGVVADYTVTADPAGDGTVPEPCTVLADAELTCTFPDLTLTDMYVFTVRSENNAGWTDVASDSIVPDAPGEPTNIEVTLGVEPGTASVTWEAPDGGGEPVTYRVTTTSDEDDTPPAVCNVAASAELSCDYTNLELDSSYVFTVRAINVAGGTDATPTEPVVPNAPDAPGTPTAEAVAENAARVTWTAPGPGGPVASYTVTAYTLDAPDAPITSEECTEVEELTCDFVGLDPAESYTFRVTATGPGGGTAQSSRSEPMTTAGPVETGTPEVVLAGPNAVQVTWEPPQSGGPILAYSVTSSPALVAPAGCTRTFEVSCVFDRLTSGTAYTFRVISHGTANRTAQSASSEPIVPGPPDAPARPMVAPTSVTGQVTVTWMAPRPGAGIAGYQVESQPGEIGCVVPAGPDATSCLVADLDPGTEYTFRVMAIGVPDSGDSAFSAPSEPIIPKAPGKPLDVEVAAGDRQIAVSWTAPAGADLRVAGYRAVTTPGGASCTTTGSTATECVITGLQNLTGYTVAVVSVGLEGLGESRPSMPSLRVRPTAGSPGSPVSVQAAGRNAGAVISWTAPANVGDGIARYTATATSLSGAQSCVTASGTVLTCTISGLTNMTEYKVTVVAVGKGAGGNSAPSAAVTVTPSVPPAAPTGVEVTQGSGKLIVRFTAGSGGGTVNNFTATAAGGPSAGPCTATIELRACEITGVTPGETYTVTVVANGVVPGTTSAPSAPSTGVKALLGAPLETLPTTNAAVAGSVSSSAGTSLRLNSTTTITGTGFAPHTGIIVGIYPGPVKWATAVTDAAGAFSVPVTVTGVTTGSSRYIVAAGLPPTGTTMRYRSLTVSILAALTPQQAFSMAGSVVAQRAPEIRRRFVG